MANVSNCNEFENQLNAYADSELTPEEKAALEMHLGTCSQCKSSLALLQSTKAGIVLLPRLKMNKELDFSFLDAANGLGCAQESESSCSEISSLLDAFHDQEVSEAEKIIVEKHLGHCFDCREVLEKIRQLSSMLKSLPVLSPRENLLDRADIAAESTILQAAPEAACKQFEPLLDAYLDQELDESEKSAFEKHLSGCAFCSLQLEKGSRIIEALKALPRLAASRDLIAGLDLSPVMPAAKSRESQSGRKLKPVWWQIGAAAAAALFFVFAVGFNQEARKANLAQDQKKQANPEIARTLPEANPEANPEARPEQSKAELASVSSASDLLADTSKSSKPVLADQKQALADSGQKNAARISPTYPPLKTKQFKIMIAEKPAELPAESRSVETEAFSELALISDTGETSADALGIATDEDGLYDIKI